MSQPTARELATLAACLRHSSEKRAAYELGIPLQTAKNRLTRLYRKLDVSCQSEAAISLGWLEVPEQYTGTSEVIAATG